MTSDYRPYTISGYGYRLGGPGGWLLPGLGPGDRLQVAWFDELNPTHQFAECATSELAVRLGVATPEVARLPWTFAVAVEVSPADWTPEASAPPPVSRLLPATSELVLADRIAADQYVLLIAASQRDRDAEDLTFYRDDDDAAGVGDGMTTGDSGPHDWDRVLIDAMTTLGFEPDALPGWLWYRRAD